MPVRLAQNDFSGGEISEALDGRIDSPKYASSLRRARNVLITEYGSIQNRPGTIFVGEVKDNSDTTRLIPFQFSTTQAYVLEFGDLIMRPIRDGGQILRTATNISAVTAASPGVFTSTSHGISNGERVYLTGITGLALSGVSQINGRVMIAANVTTHTFTLTDLYGTAFSTASLTAYSSGGTVARLYEVASPFAQGHVFALSYAQTADTMLMAHQSYAPRSLTRSGHASWSFSTITFGPTVAPSASVAAVNTVGTGVTTYTYVITAYDDETGEEGLPSGEADCTNNLTVSGNYNTITWAAVSGAERYFVYKEDGGVFGYIGGTTGLSFIDNNILPDLGDTPPGSRNPFASDYPAIVDFHQGRSIWANTPLVPGGVWHSVTNLYTNLNVATPAKADDAMSYNFRPGVNAVRGLVSLGRLLAFTTDGEWTIDGGGVTQAVTPASLSTRRYSTRGAAQLRPLAVGDIALFVQRQGAKVRASGYSYEKDGYRTNDLTILARHLFRGYTVVDWCYQQDPDSIVWAVRSDGKVLSLTFIEESNTFAWALHTFGGSFGSGHAVVESCCAIDGDAQDDVIFVIKRTINGQTKRYIERLAPRWDGDSEDIADAYFVDGGMTVTNSPASVTVSGLWHLEGQSVGGIADGSPFSGKTVSGGQITLDVAAETIQVGLLYESEMTLLPVYNPGRGGASQGTPKVAGELVFKLKDTVGISFGPDDGGTVDVLLGRKLPGHSDPTEPFSGDTENMANRIKWGDGVDGRVTIKQTTARPMEVLAVYRGVELGG